MNIIGIDRRNRILSICCCCPRTIATAVLVEKLEAQGWEISHGLCRTHFLDQLRQAIELKIVEKLDTREIRDRETLELDLPRNCSSPAPAAAGGQAEGLGITLDTQKT